MTPEVSEASGIDSVITRCLSAQARCCCFDRNFFGFVTRGWSQRVGHAIGEHGLFRRHHEPPHASSSLYGFQTWPFCTVVLTSSSRSDRAQRPFIAQARRGCNGELSTHALRNGIKTRGQPHLHRLRYALESVSAMKRASQSSNTMWSSQEGSESRSLRLPLHAGSVLDLSKFRVDVIVFTTSTAVSTLLQPLSDSTSAYW
ncbi:hypothetical protein BKA63DRAFT_16179 [Paraphoma chrysanthemicola]|nr:hypothetical protein BKA63DRAFT_16179 [Paraphoma chrysanthemicola]